ncbi:bifunctional DNA primase/polymerase-like protein [Nocardia tenerifensis]|uniref:Bifunctional DNA primase/polymerase-like protein n=1 Tax=Nocardia tenerifensis TaxID=228006 RepID=A0A318KAJ4_9NOCA|nr:bifunctional DNA primase/polymerase [Nocardia tenerifensis]PXX53429.1 bifunctional DNA primase/polymerase-like protein [Nocardia tenerifensis]
MGTVDFRQAAISAAARGWSVFPLCPGSKRPAICQWQQRATVDPSQIHSWWREDPYRNIAIATGPSRLYVIDLDTAACPNAGDRSGWELFNDLATAADASGTLATYTVATPSGGHHLYYRTPPRKALSCTVGRLGPGIDSRGEGGYIVAAGSLTSRGTYRRLDARPPTHLPQWLYDLYQPAPHPTLDRPPSPPHDRDRYLAAILDSEIQRIVSARVGTRNDTLFRAALTLGRLVAGGELDRHDTDSALAVAASVHVGSHAFTAEEVTRTIANGFAAGAQRPRRIRRNTWPQ